MSDLRFAHSNCLEYMVHKFEKSEGIVLFHGNALEDRHAYLKKKDTGSVDVCSHPKLLSLLGQ